MYCTARPLASTNIVPVLGSRLAQRENEPRLGISAQFFSSGLMTRSAVPAVRKGTGSCSSTMSMSRYSAL